MPTISRRSVLQYTVAGAAAARLSSASGQAPIVLKFSHVVAPDTPKGKGALHFKALAEQRTQGRIRVDIYPNSKLYRDEEELQALQRGAVQMLAPSVSKLGPLGLPEFEIFDLPFLFKDEEAFRALTDGPLGARLFQQLESRGIRGMAYWDNGFHIMSANRPLHVVKDFRGLKMRIQNSTMLDAEMRALGAVPQVIAFSDLYQALRSGTVDGTEGVASNFYTQKLYEVQRHMSISHHGHLAYAVIINKAFWEELPPDIRHAIDSAMRDSTRYANAIANTENIQALEKIRANGATTIYTPTPEELAGWKRALMPVHAQAQNRIGKETMALANQAAGFVTPR